MTEDIPEYILEAEYNLWDWSWSDPLDCMKQSADKSAQRKYHILDREIQYHLGAWTAAQHTCNALYKIEGIEGRYYPKHHPPWLKDAVRRKDELYNEAYDEDEWENFM